MRRGFFSTVPGKIVGLLIALALVVLATHWLAGMSPSESNRVRHRAGYSIVHPEGWTPDMRHGTGKPIAGESPTRDLILMTPDRYKGPSPAMFVKRLTGGIDREILKQSGWSEGRFQDQPAMVCTRMLKHTLQHLAYFERAGQWFEVGQLLPYGAQIHDAEWWPFLETFKYPDGNVDPETIQPINASTIPSTEPSTQPFDF